jgi:hypothetical protein
VNRVIIMIYYKQVLVILLIMQVGRELLVNDFVCSLLDSRRTLFDCLFFSVMRLVVARHRTTNMTSIEHRLIDSIRIV